MLVELLVEPVSWDEDEPMGAVSEVSVTDENGVEVVSIKVELK